MSLFIPDAHFVVYMNAKDPTPSQELHSRQALALVFAQLNKYDATTHFVGQSTIFSLTADRATGEAYCLAHHVKLDGTKRRLMVASLRYLDTFVKMDNSWLFAERRLYVDWLEERALSWTVSQAGLMSASESEMNVTTAGQKNLVIVGATGMVGGCALRYTLEHPAVGRATTIARRVVSISHPKLKEVLHQDFADCSARAEALSNQYAAVFCLGAYTGAVPDTELHMITVD